MVLLLSAFINSKYLIPIFSLQVIYTFLLCFVVLNVACSSASKDNQYYGLAIGSVIICGGYAVGNISGGAFNPAVALGIDLASWHKGFGYSLLYTVFEVSAIDNKYMANGYIRSLHRTIVHGSIAYTRL
jgi:glycerol uptake facilitator-like aquaporin